MPSYTARTQARLAQRRTTIFALREHIKSAHALTSELGRVRAEAESIFATLERDTWIYPQAEAGVGRIREFHARVSEHTVLCERALECELSED